MFWNEPVVVAAAAVLIAGVMAGAALHKGLDLLAFRETLRSYALVPAPFLRPLAFVLPGAEAAVAILLLAPATRGFGAGAAVLLLAVYTAALALNLARGRTDIACGCSWGQGGQGLSGWLLVRNAALLVAAAVASGGEAGGEIGVAGAVVATAAGVSLLVAYHAGDRLIGNWPALRELRRT